MREQREHTNRVPSETQRPPLIKRTVPAPVVQNPKPQSEDLRAILKRIAQGANENGGKEEKKQMSRPHTPDRVDLKQALSTIQDAHKKENVAPEAEIIVANVNASAI
jgi:hypothetical protein